MSYAIPIIMCSLCAVVGFVLGRTMPSRKAKERAVQNFLASVKLPDNGWHEDFELESRRMASGDTRNLY